MLSLLLASAAVAAPTAHVAAPRPPTPLVLRQFSDAQCPCSAQFQSDVKAQFLDAPAFKGLVSFQQYLVGGTFTNPAKVQDCIHGAEECVAHRYFACAQHLAGPKENGNVTYAESSKWLDFQHCAYGKCTGCAAIFGEHCPCYSTSAAAPAPAPPPAAAAPNTPPAEHRLHRLPRDQQEQHHAALRSDRRAGLDGPQHVREQHERAG